MISTRNNKAVNYNNKMAILSKNRYSIKAFDGFRSLGGRKLANSLNLC